MNVAACPSAERLRWLLDGAAADTSDTADHVQACSACQSRLEELCAPGNHLIEALRGQTPPPIDDPAEYQQAMNRFMGGAAIGQQLGEYRLLEKIGQGGMGSVFRARHARLEKTVAVKLVAPGRSRDPAVLARFAREMKAAGRLDHPNIVQATDAGEADGVPYLVMEYLSGSADLARLVKERGPLPFAESCAIIREAALGLHHAHESGLIHRDVKPSNVLIARDGTVKLLDLGLALLAEDPTAVVDDDPSGTTDPGNEGLTSASLIVGTRHYMAPEQKRDAHNLDARADIYGLGRTLCYLLTGTPVPAGLPGIPRGLQSVLARMTAERPADRYPTAIAAADDLKRWARGANVLRLLENAGSIPPRANWPRWLGTAVALLVATGLVAWAAIVLRPAPLIAEAPGDDAVVSAAVPTPLAPGKLPMSNAEAQQLQVAWAKEVGAPIDLAPEVGPAFRLIPPGELGLSGELRVRITRAYYLGVCEITCGQFEKFITSTGYKTWPQRNGRGSTMVYLVPRDNTMVHTQLTKPEYQWNAPGHMESSAAHPVTCITWDDADAYCRWLSQQVGAVCRLPSEAEWKWAARAGDVRAAPQLQAAGDAWLAHNTKQPQPVGRTKANVWGLFDMVGNVGEYCADGHADYPTGRIDDFIAPPAGPLKMRTSCASNYLTYTPIYDYRQPASPYNGGASNNGFRVLRELPPG